jgi:hypothetical protein
LFCLTFCQELKAVVYPIAVNVKSMSLASSIVSRTDHWALFGNPSLLTFKEKTSIGLFNSTKFGISDLNSTGFASNFKTKQGHFGLAFSHYGIKEFNRQNIVAGFGRKFGGLTIGASGSYILINMANSTTKSLMLNLGLTYSFTDDFLMSFSGVNINRAILKDNSEERLESIYALGARLKLSKEVSMYPEVEYQFDLERTIVKIGLEYKLNESISFLSGIATEGDVFNLGGMYSKDKWQSGLAFSYHQYLGFTPSVSVSYKIN